MMLVLCACHVLFSFETLAPTPVIPDGFPSLTVPSSPAPVAYEWGTEPSTREAAARHMAPVTMTARWMVPSEAIRTARSKSCVHTVRSDQELTVDLARVAALGG